MPYTSLPTVAAGQPVKASWGNQVDTDLDDHEARIADLETAVGSPGPGSGDVTGPGVATDNAIARFDGTTGLIIQSSGIAIADGAAGTLDGSNSGDVTLAGSPNYLTIAAQIITRALIDLTAHVTGRLPWANVAQVTAARLLGRASASGLGDVEELTLGTGLAWNGTAIDCTVIAPGVTPGSRLISGGQIVWISAYTFTVSAAVYVIGGTQYTSAEQTISLDAADPTDDRIDVIAVDDTGTVIGVTGTPAAQPSEPDIDPATQLKLGIVFVAASSSTPTVTNDTIYAEHAGGPGEWNWTTSGTGINVNSTNNPHGGTKTIEGTTVASGAYALAAKPSGTLDITTYNLLIFYIRSKVTWNNNRSLQIQFRTAGVLVGSPVTFKHNTYGFDSSQITTYQQIAIPITAFAIPAGTLIDQLRFMDAGGSIGFYLDDVTLQSGGSNNATGGISQDQADARYAQRANNLSDLTSASTARTNISAVAKAASSTDNAIARFDGTGGATVQNSTPTVADDGRISNVTNPSGAQDAATKAYVDAAAGAPLAAQYVTLATDATLTNERVLTGTSNQIMVTDGGAGLPVTLSTPQDLHTAATPQFGRMGLAVAADSSAKLKIAGQYGSTLYDAGNSSTAITLDWDNGNTHLVTLTGAAVFTLSNPKDGFRYLLILKQDGTGSRVVTWPAAVKWAAGTAPTLTLTAGHVDVVTLVWVAGIGASGNYVAAANLDYTPA